ncbi:MAG: cardiolipin synthase [Clostridia bacterium]|nr:cardiolipin synthase [Clostridia bacterium]
MKKILRFLTHRLVILSLLLIFQFLLLVLFIVDLNDYYVQYSTLSIIVATLCALHIINNDSNPAYKTAWILPLIVFPMLGVLIYLIFGKDNLSKRQINKMTIVNEKQEELCKSNYNPHTVMDDAVGNKQSLYMEKYAYSPLYKNTYAEYLSSGEKKLSALLCELEKAEKYIFMEYFIIHDGDMWERTLDVLKRKASEGLDVRIIYDDFGCAMGLPKKYPDELKKYGIKCCIFNKLKPVLSPKLNNRDHRKICVIDGKVAFTGGINFGDEYINKKERFGYWKDTAVMIKGEASFSLTAMFLGMWRYITNEDEPLEKFHSEGLTESSCDKNDGYVQPYCDNPTDREAVGQNVYLNMINSAKKYILITTPYLIIDNVIRTALCNAAKSGVTVVIITPGVPDKKLVFQVTRSNYSELLRAGVRIFEFSPGFIHAKMFDVDGKYATVGTVNLDYRSLYLHFECGLWLAHCECIKDIENDIVKTLDVCEEIPRDFVIRKTGIKKLFYAVVRAFAPLM